MNRLLVIALVAAAAVLYTTGCEQQKEKPKTSDSKAQVQSYYRVQTGDTMQSIAEKAYGDASYAPQVATANPGIDAKNLKRGQELILPRVKDPTGKWVEPISCERRTIY